MKSKPVKINGKLFRYDYDNSVVEYIYKPIPEEIADNAEWETRHGYPLYHVDENGYEVLDSVGLRRENWDDKEMRTEYLHGWAEELEMKSKDLLYSIGQVIGFIGILVGFVYLRVQYGSADLENMEYSEYSIFRDRPKPDSSESDEDCTSAIKAIQFFKKDALNRLYECDKVDLARKIYDIAERAPCELVKLAAIGALEDISNSLCYESDKNDVSELIADIVEL